MFTYLLFPKAKASYCITANTNKQACYIYKTMVSFKTLATLQGVELLKFETHQGSRSYESWQELIS